MGTNPGAASMEDRQQARHEQEARSLAHSHAQSAQPPQQRRGADMWDRLGDADVGNGMEGDELDAALGTELSDKFAFGYLRPDEQRSLWWLVENEMDRASKEYPRGDSLCTGVRRAIMTDETGPDGQPAPKPVLSPSEARRFHAAGQVKKMMLSLSGGGHGLRSMTTIRTEAVSKTERPTDDGRITSLKKRVFG